MSGEAVDIPTRLRRGIALDGGGKTFTKAGIMDEAADEIDRLTVEVERWKRQSFYPLGDNHHNALAIFSDESSRTPQLKNLLAILKMAEHICSSYRVLGSQAEDHEWNAIGHLVLDYVGLSDYDFESMKLSIRELGAH